MSLSLDGCRRICDDLRDLMNDHLLGTYLDAVTIKALYSLPEKARREVTRAVLHTATLERRVEVHKRRERVLRRWLRVYRNRWLHRRVSS